MYCSFAIARDGETWCCVKGTKVARPLTIPDELLDIKDPTWLYRFLKYKPTNRSTEAGYLYKREVM